MFVLDHLKRVLEKVNTHLIFSLSSTHYIICILTYVFSLVLTKPGCRPIIGLDGCHLKGPFGGQLLSAVGTDSNDGMYPIAWAVVETEDTSSWTWFLELLVQDLGVENSHHWTFISDKQKVKKCLDLYTLSHMA